jgi:DNA polymerase-3 subunit chi
MIKISCYQTTEAQLIKAFCQLVEKCYYSGLRTIVFAENENYRNDLDRVLWTYSKKHFIAHATSSDPLPERQPVYLTEDLAKYNQSEIIVFVNPEPSSILKALGEKEITNSKQLQKIFFILDDAGKNRINEIKNLLEKSSLKKESMSVFHQNAAGGWQESGK